MLIEGPPNAKETVILAHGAGGAMDSPFMNRIAKALAERRLRVVRFEFPYMAARRTGAGRGAPDRPPVLMASWRETIDTVGGRVIIGGKSLGGRIASMVADEAGVRGLVCLGYPFHPPRDPAKLRTGHLRDLRTPTLIIQGTRDPFGSPDEVSGYELSPAIRVKWIEDGDHSLKPRASSGRTESQNLEEAVELIAAFAGGLD